MSYGGILNQSGAGTYTAEEILPDSLKLQYGLSESAVPADVFENILMRFEMANRNAGLVNVYIHDTAGNPLPGVIINNITSIDNFTVITNENGKASGFASAGSVTVGVSQYADIENVSQVISVEVGKVYSVELTATTRNFLKITSTGNYRFSANVSRVDVSVGGGGGNGEVHNSAGAGGGGGYSTIQEDVDFEINTLYQAVVGNSGQQSSIMGVVAKGGNPASNRRGGTGNGTGGNPGYPGTNGTTYIYTSFTQQSLYGGGGGGGADDGQNRGTGGSPGGGAGGYEDGWGNRNGTNGTNGLGGGGGGTGIHDGSVSGYAGKGGSGVVAIRMHLKTA